MKDKKTMPRSFKPWPENNARLEYAQQLGLEVSHVVNELLKTHLKDYLERAKSSKMKALSIPIP
jgi:hypothetical protein